MQPQSPAFSRFAAGFEISPQQLSSSQVRAIQQALEEWGEEHVRVDGEWGADTEAALKNFQKSENMITQTGEVDLPTIVALGLDPLSFGLAGASETTGQAPDSATSPSQPLPGGPAPPKVDRQAR